MSMKRPRDLDGRSLLLVRHRNVAQPFAPTANRYFAVPFNFTTSRTEPIMIRHTFRWSTLVAVIALSTACAGGDDTADDLDAGEPVQEAEDAQASEGEGEIALTISGDLTADVTGTDVQCTEFRGTRMITAVGEHHGEAIDIGASNETFDDGTVGKVILGGYVRSAGQGGTITVDENGATFEDLEVGAVTVNGSITC